MDALSSLVYVWLNNKGSIIKLLMVNDNEEHTLRSKLPWRLHSNQKPISTIVDLNLFGGYIFRILRLEINYSCEWQCRHVWHTFHPTFMMRLPFKEKILFFMVCKTLQCSQTPSLKLFPNTESAIKYVWPKHIAYLVSRSAKSLQRVKTAIVFLSCVHPGIQAARNTSYWFSV